MLEAPSKKEVGKMYTDLPSDLSGMGNETTQLEGGMGGGSNQTDLTSEKKEEDVEIGLEDEDVNLHDVDILE